MGLTAVGLFSLATLGETTALWFIAAVLLMLGTGFGIFSSPNTNAVMSAVDRRFYGVASGTLGTMRLTGQMTSMAIAMTVFAVHLGREPIGAENHAAFVVVRADRLRGLRATLLWRRPGVAGARQGARPGTGIGEGGHRLTRSTAIRLGTAPSEGPR